MLVRYYSVSLKLREDIIDDVLLLVVRTLGGANRVPLFFCKLTWYLLILLAQVAAAICKSSFLEDNNLTSSATQLHMRSAMAIVSTRLS